MSRDFILVLSGGVVALATTFIVLFIMDWVYRRESLSDAPKIVKPKREPAQQSAPARVETVPLPAPMPPAKPVDKPRPVSRTEPLHQDALPPPETILDPSLKEDNAA